MSTVPEEKAWTPAEYLAFDDASEERWDFYRGEIFNMSGANFAHNVISGNAYSSIHVQLAERPCHVFMNDMRVDVSERGLYTYSDIVVTCEEPRFAADQFDTLLNPQVIIEVLSDSTEQNDRGTKFEMLRSLNSLQEYLLFAQDRAHVDCFRLNAEGNWVLSDATGLEAKIELPSIQCELRLADVYAKLALDG